MWYHLLTPSTSTDLVFIIILFCLNKTTKQLASLPRSHKANRTAHNCICWTQLWAKTKTTKTHFQNFHFPKSEVILQVFYNYPKSIAIILMSVSTAFNAARNLGFWNLKCLQTIKNWNIMKIVKLVEKNTNEMG